MQFTTDFNLAERTINAVANARNINNGNVVVDFNAYLQQSRYAAFTLDLSNATLMEVIEHIIVIKEKVYPKYRKQLSCLIKHLEAIQNDFNCVLMPHQITDIFWYNFIPYLLNKGILLSSIKTLASQLRAVLTWASKYNARVSPTFDFMKIPDYKRQQVALTPDEVSRIYHFDINTIPRRKQYIRHMETIKDMFVLSCNLGQRYSDMIRIDKSCFDRNIFSIVQQKTGNKAVVDINKFSIDKNTTYAILEKYNWNSPTRMDISSYNKYLKYFLDYVGLNDIVKQENKVGGEIETILIPKRKLICSHTGRRTFITNNIVRNIPIAEIMRASGHKNYTSFQKYICYND